MATLPAYTLDKKLLSQLVGAMETVSIHSDAKGAPESTPQGLQQIWKCSDAGGQLFVLWATELCDGNALHLPPGTVYLEVWPREKNAAKRKPREVSAALVRLDQALVRIGGKRHR